MPVMGRKDTFFGRSKGHETFGRKADPTVIAARKKLKRDKNGRVITRTTLRKS